MINSVNRDSVSEEEQPVAREAIALMQQALELLDAARDSTTAACYLSMAIHAAGGEEKVG